MVGPFAMFFHIKPWELRADLLTHEEFLALERLALQLMAQRKGGSGGE